MRVQGDEPKVQIEIEESYAIVRGFDTANEDLAKGQFVKLDADGSVSAVTAATQVALGYIVSAYKGTSPGTVRVMTPFNAIFTDAISSGTTATGAFVAANGVDADGKPTFVTATAGQTAVGMVLTGGATGATIEVGILRVPRVVA